MEKGKVSIDVDKNKGRLQSKLRAIANHTEALPNELDEIDKDTCPEYREALDAQRLCNKINRTID
ncbi:hypothetical protein ABEY41_03080 [Peribacillus butanolivorans]|uniref:hypothetical protein n=1 Tax=Peribacillus butanolivorans TaxID=421767 RepID=UPI003D2DE63F